MIFVLQNEETFIWCVQFGYRHYFGNKSINTLNKYINQIRWSVTKISVCRLTENSVSKYVYICIYCLINADGIFSYFTVPPVREAKIRGLKSSGEWALQSMFCYACHRRSLLAHICWTIIMHNEWSTWAMLNILMHSFWNSFTSIKAPFEFKGSHENIETS